MSATWYRFTLVDGGIITGPVQGSGGLVGGGPRNLDRLRLAIERATYGRPTGLYEPRPGCASVYPDYSVVDLGEPVVVPLIGTTVENADAPARTR